MIYKAWKDVELLKLIYFIGPMASNSLVNIELKIALKAQKMFLVQNVFP